jgi:prolyl-tRNA synthetase
VTRTVQAAIEQSHDKDGIIWPVSIAPYHIHLCVLDPQDPAVAAAAEQYSFDWQSEGLDVFVDDREERPGVKFKDADLLGMPIRVVLGKRGLENNEVEVVERKTKVVKKVPRTLVKNEVLALFKQISRVGQ